MVFGRAASLGMWVRLLPFIEQDMVFDEFDYSQVAYSTYNLEVAARCPMHVLLCPSGSQELSAQSKQADIGARTTHYYGISGPIGTNPATGETYEVYRSGAITGPGRWGNISQEGFFPYSKTIKFRDAKDGLSNTIAVGEISWDDFTGYRTWNSSTYWGGGTHLVTFTTKNVFQSWPINSINNGLHNNGPFGSEHPGGANFCLGDGSVQFLSETIDMNLWVGLASCSGNEVVTMP